MMTIVAVRGAWGTVEFVADDDGESELWKIFGTLPEAERAALHAAMQLLAETGRIRSSDKFKKVSGEIWEFRRFQQRFLGFYLPGGRFVVASHEVKKKDRLSKETIARAESISMRFNAEEPRRCKKAKGSAPNSRTRPTVASSSRKG
jgi:hypothetical protein